MPSTTRPHVHICGDDQNRTGANVLALQASALPTELHLQFHWNPLNQYYRLSFSPQFLDLNRWTRLAISHVIQYYRPLVGDFKSFYAVGKTGFEPASPWLLTRPLKK